MLPRRVLISLTLLLGCISAGPPASQPAEVASELGDLWRDRDAFYLRVDGRTPKPAGAAPVGTRQMVVRAEAMARGRPFPNRWTTLEIEMRSAIAQPLTIGYAGEPSTSVSLAANTWVPVRLPLPAKVLRDVLIQPAAPLTGPLEFRKVRLVDDRWEVWEDGWTISRLAAIYTLTPRSGPALTFPAQTTTFEEVGPLRALVTTAAGPRTIYANGRVYPSTQPAALDLVVTLPPDTGRLDRQSPDDRDGDGYAEDRGCTLVKVTGRRVVLTIAAPTLTPSPQPVIEISGLSEGDATVLWEGKLLTTHDRTATGTLIIQVPGNVTDKPSQLEISVPLVEAAQHRPE